MEQKQDFEQFTWKNQVRYRCCRTWESGHKCEYDSHDLAQIHEHVRASHGRMAHLDDKRKQQQSAAPPPAPKLVDHTGKPLPITEDPVVQKAQFKP